MINRYASLKQGLVGAWCPSLGASGFRLIDRSGYNNHGTLNNMDTATDWVPSGGKLALDFDGVNDYVDINIYKPSSTMTVSLWVNIRNFSNSPLIYAWINSSLSPDFGFLETNSGGDRLFFGNRNTSTTQTSFRDYTLSTALQASKWVHLTTVKYIGSDTGDLFLNGVRQTSFTGQLYATTGDSDRLRLAAYVSFPTATNGQLDDVRLYSRALTPSEILLLYTGGRGVGLAPERIKHRRKTSAAATNRRRRILIGASQ